MENKNQPINAVMMRQTGDNEFRMAKDGEKEFLHSCAGLTKREWFAGMALQGFLANKWSIEGNYSTEQMAEMAIQLADEILKQLEK